VTAMAEAVGGAGNGTRRCDDDQVRDLRRGLGGEEFVTYNLKEVRGGNERDQKTIRSVVTLN
jgi:hypothetical protein